MFYISKNGFYLTFQMLLYRHTNAGSKISLYDRAHKKIVSRKSRTLNPESFRIIYPQSLSNACLQAYRNNRIR